MLTRSDRTKSSRNSDSLWNSDLVQSMVAFVCFLFFVFCRFAIDAFRLCCYYQLFFSRYERMIWKRASNGVTFEKRAFMALRWRKRVVWQKFKLPDAWPCGFNIRVSAVRELFLGNGAMIYKVKLQSSVEEFASKFCESNAQRIKIAQCLLRAFS